MSTQDLSKLKIKDYKYWTLMLHSNQGYLGRCVAWCKREDTVDLVDISAEERNELFVLLSEAKQALQKAFSPDLLNYAFLGNQTRHLHGHIVPRFRRPVEFESVTFTDKHSGHNFQTDYSFAISDELIEKIILKIKGNI